jgi:NAD(P)-dependent dehydrogenase (short-subunit alcohol dehydrogenase family)
VTRRTWNDDVHVVALDLADLASVRKAAEDILSRWDRLDVLVNNAGGTWTRRQLTAQGFEYTFGVNHLGHFYLTNLLLPRLEGDAPSRVVAVTSIGHHFARGGMRFDDLQSERHYEGMDAYCRSKLANVLFVRELARREDAAGLTANAAHPGWVRSSFAMDGDTEGITGFGMRVMRPLQISPRRGARTSIYLATSPEVAGQTGLYWVRSKPGRMSQHARDDAAAARLWSESEQMLASAGFGLG